MNSIPFVPIIPANSDSLSHQHSHQYQ